MACSPKPCMIGLWRVTKAAKQGRAARAVTTTKTVTLSALGLAAFLILWELFPALGLVSANILPPPSALPGAFWREVSSGIWLSSLIRSLSHYLAGLAIGCFLGVSLGIITGLWVSIEATLAWVVRILRPIPGLAWVPFAILWFGIDPAAAIFIISTGVFWISYFAALGAVRAVDRDLDRTRRCVRLPPRRSEVVQGDPAGGDARHSGRRAHRARASLDGGGGGRDLRRAGLGQRMMQASNLLASDVVVIYMATMAAAYGAIDSIFVAIQSRLLRWKR